MKRCSTCGVEKEATRENFSPEPRTKCGLQAQCKACKRADYRTLAESRHIHPEEAPDTKVCSTCGVKKDAEEFYRWTVSPDGRSHLCKECRQKYRKEQYAANKDEAIAAAKAWKHANPEKARKNNQSWILRNPEKHAESMRAGGKKWRARNPEAVKAFNHKRRARKRQAPGHWTSEDLSRLHEAQGGTCHYCQASLEDGYHIDHKIPLSRPELEPTNWPENLCLTCPSCNIRKRNKTDSEFIAFLHT